MINQIHPSAPTFFGSLHFQWAVYEHWHYTQDGTASIVRVGVSKLSDVFNVTEDANALRIVGYGDRDDCLNYAPALAAQHGPDTELRLDRGAQTKNRPIKCSNGQTYANQSEAARALNINQSQLSKHLRMLPGHHMVKELMFWYV